MASQFSKYTLRVSGSSGKSDGSSLMYCFGGDFLINGSIRFFSGAATVAVGGLPLSSGHALCKFYHGTFFFVSLPVVSPSEFFVGLSR